MAVYVDDMQAKHRSMIMCHMIADTSEELDEMAELIGVQLKWKQFPGTPREHYDISKAKRALAVKLGAVEVTQRELAKMIRIRPTT
jgi:hypothetical protein